MLHSSFIHSYDPLEDRWTLVQAMHSKRLGVGVAVVNRLLYAIGGFDGKERLASIECYHPENNAWTNLPSMSVGRSGSGVAALNQFIYVVGGFDGTRQLSSVERYDTEQQTWDSVQPIKIARSALSLTVLDGKLYAMGGFDGHTFLSIVEVYDPELDKWQEGTPLTSGRSGHASAVIYQPSCASAYMDCIERQMNSEKRPPCPPDDTEGSDRQNAPPGNSNVAMQPYSGSHCNHCTDGSRSSENTPNDNSLLLPEQRSQLSLPTQPVLNGDDDVNVLEDAVMDSTDESIGYYPDCIALDGEQALNMITESEDMKADKPSDPNVSVMKIGLPMLAIPPDLNLAVSPTDATEFVDANSEENPKKCRRKCFSRCRTFRRSNSDNGNLANSVDSSDSNSSNNSRNQCTFSKLKNSFRQNLNGLVSWSSATQPPTDETGERKSCRFRNYYKCKMK